MYALSDLPVFVRQPVRDNPLLKESVCLECGKHIAVSGSVLILTMVEAAHVAFGCMWLRG